MAQVVKADPSNERAWLWLGYSMADPEQSRFCFQKVLEINPYNNAALQGMQKISQGSALAPGITHQVTPPASEASQPESEESTEVEQAETPVPQPEKEAPAPVAEQAPLEIRQLRVATGFESEPPKPPDLEEEPEETEETEETEESALSLPKPKARGRVLAPVLGLLLGLLVFGGPIGYLAFSNQLDRFGRFAIARIQPLPPTAIPVSAASFTQTPTPTEYLTETPTASPVPPTATATLDPTQDYNLRVQAIYSKITQAQDLMEQQRYAEAITYWDLVIMAVPDYVDGYSKRAESYIKILDNPGGQQEFVDYTESAIADLDRAIETGPATGDLFMDRYSMYLTLAGLQDYRIDQDSLKNVALENLQAAVVLGNDSNLSDLDVASLLFDLGRCQEGMDLLKPLQASRTVNGVDLAGLNTQLAKGNYCLGKNLAGLQIINNVLKTSPDNQRLFLRTLLLFNLGMKREALTTINQWIDRQPKFDGYRYYLRALINYDLNKKDLARQDLATGAVNSWNHSGLYSYVQGLLSLDSGNRDAGIQQIQYAEATLGWEYPGILDRIRKDLARLKAETLAPSPQVTLTVTPIPAQPARPTPEPLPTSAETPTKVVPTLTPMPLVLPPGNPIDVTLERGTGAITIRQNDYLYFHFHPTTQVALQKVQDLFFHIIITDVKSAPSLQLYLWDITKGKWDTYSPRWGDTDIADPQRYITPAGEIFAALRSWNDQNYSIYNIGFTYLGIANDGSTTQYGMNETNEPTGTSTPVEAGAPTVSSEMTETSTPASP